MLRARLFAIICFIVLGAVYSHSKSGWFDMSTFKQWFMKCLLPYVAKLSGKKILIGDNLGCHFNVEVIRACVANDIAFVPLLPNCTHLMQPLDVAVFRPLKLIWTKVLLQWRRESRISGYIPKTIFRNF